MKLGFCALLSMMLSPSRSHAHVAGPAGSLVKVASVKVTLRGVGPLVGVVEEHAVERVVDPQILERLLETRREAGVLGLRLRQDEAHHLVLGAEDGLDVLLELRLDLGLGDLVVDGSALPPAHEAMLADGQDGSLAVLDEAREPVEEVVLLREDRDAVDRLEDVRRRALGATEVDRHAVTAGLFDAAALRLREQRHEMSEHPPAVEQQVERQDQNRENAEHTADKSGNGIDKCRDRVGAASARRLLHLE